MQELGNLECRTLFSTHYHTLVEEFRHSVKVTLGHMVRFGHLDLLRLNVTDFRYETHNVIYKRNKFSSVDPTVEEYVWLFLIVRDV